VTPTTLPALAAAHDLFIVDQYGVLHDGVRPYPGAPEALLRLREGGARVAILSNSGKRAAVNEARLVALGFDPGGWDAFVSSGEVAHAKLASTVDPPRCLVLARGDDGGLLDGLETRIVSRAEEADLVLIAIGFSGLLLDTYLEGFDFALDRRTNIAANTDDYRTRVPKVYAAGDVRRGQSLVVWAIREGRQAARSVDEALMGASELPR